jgi:cell wall-associated NlpC family hydrolase
MRMRRPPRSFLVALVLLAGIAAVTGAWASRAPAATPAALIDPVPSPLSVAPVLERAAARIEAQQAAAAKSRRPRREAPQRPSTQTVDPAADAPARRATPSRDPALVKADVLANGIALPPLDAPAEVRAIIEAGNAIARTPYKWGGGHGRWQDTGYDCSGSVSFALASAGLLDGPLASGPLMSWGEAGPGRWITVWSNPGHVFLEVAGVRFDTSGARVSGSRWQSAMRSTEGFVARHPAGL